MKEQVGRAVGRGKIGPAVFIQILNLDEFLVVLREPLFLLSAQTLGGNWKGIYFCEEAIKLAFKYPIPFSLSPLFPHLIISPLLEASPFLQGLTFISLVLNSTSGLVEERTERCVVWEMVGRAESHYIASL